MAAVEKSIVHISAQYVDINYRRPTSTLEPYPKTGSGWVADLFELSDFQDRDNPTYLQWIKKLGIPLDKQGRAIVIVSNAHVIHRQVSLQIRLASSAKKYDTKVIGIAEDRDLVILAVSDPAFIAQVSPCPVDHKLPSKETKIASYGFAQNGTDLAFSDGVFSRTSNMPYSFSKQSLLNLEVTAAINPGCSGGIICDASSNRVIGIIHQVATGANQQSYAIPMMYLKNVARELLLSGRTMGLPTLSIAAESLQDKSKRSFFGLEPEGEHGIFIRKILSSHQTTLLPGDIILAIDGHQIKSDGTIHLDGLNFSFNSILQQRLVFEEVTLTVFRDKQTLSLQAPLRNASTELNKIPTCPSESMPPYLYKHGILFTTLHASASNFYKNTLGQNATPVNLYQHMAENPSKTPTARAVIYIQFMGGQELAGYGNEFENAVITHINGHPIVDIWSVKHILDSLPPEEPYLRIRTESSDVDNVIIPVADAKREAALQKLYKVHSPEALVSHFDLWKKAARAIGFINQLQSQVLRKKQAALATLAPPHSTTDSSLDAATGTTESTSTATPADDTTSHKDTTKRLGAC